MKKAKIAFTVILIVIALLVYYFITFQIEIGRNNLAKENYQKNAYLQTFQELSLNSPEIEDLKYEGNQNAPLSIIFVADLNSQDSAVFYKNTLPELEKKYVLTGQAKLYHKYIITKEELSTKSGVYPKVQAARCFANLTNNSTIGFQIVLAQAIGNDFVSLAQAYGLDGEQFKNCVENTDFRSTYLDMLESEQYLIQGPSIYLGVNGRDNALMYGTPELADIYDRMRLKEIKVGLN